MDPPTAVFASQNQITVGAIQALRQRGLQHTIAMVGYDDVSFAHLIDPPLTVVAQDVGGMGRLAAQQLFNRLEGDDGPAQELLVQTRLIARGSGEIRPLRR